MRSIAVARPPDSVSAAAQTVPAAVLRVDAARPLPISRLELAPDDLGLAGARVAIADNNTTGAFLGQEFTLTEIVAPPDAAAAAMERLKAEGIRFVATMADAETTLMLADAAGADMLVMNALAPDDRLRNELVPVNTRWNVGEVVDAAYRYFQQTGRRVSIEYALIKDINDQGWRADLLAKKLNARGKGWVHVNPIPLNPTPGSKWTASRKGVEQNFVERLRAGGIPTTVRDDLRLVLRSASSARLMKIPTGCRDRWCLVQDRAEAPRPSSPIHLFWKSAENQDFSRPCKPHRPSARPEHPTPSNFCGTSLEVCPSSWHHL